MTVMSEDDDDMEEERRLCYVGITRAKKKLYLSAAKRRMMQGRTQFNKVSRFIDEIPEQLLQLDTGVNFKENVQIKHCFHQIAVIDLENHIKQNHLLQRKWILYHMMLEIW